MALVNKGTATGTIAEVNQTLVSSYNEFFKVVESAVGDLVTTQPLATANFVHSFIEGYPTERLWNDEKIVKSLKMAQIAGKTEKYENTIGIDVEDLMSGILAPFVASLENLGMQAATYVDRRVAEFLQNGTSSDAKYQNFDAQPLFSTAHPNADGTTQSNNLTSTALSSTNLITAVEAMMAFTDPLGNPLKIRPTHLIVPSQLALTAKALVENPFDASGATNVLYNSLKVVHLPELDSASTTWYLAAVKGSVTPFMNYEFQGPTFVQKNSPEDDNFFWDDQAIYGYTVRSSVKAAPWYLLLRAIA